MMSSKTIRFTVRLMLVVLLATFTSPGFAWQSVASHSPLAPMDLSGMHHDHDGDSHAHGHEHDDAAHSQIGHLLSHLPVVTAHVVPPLPRIDGGVIYPAHHPASPDGNPEPPYKPPRSHLYA